MKKCPYCTAQNRDEATVCYNCGRDLDYQVVPPADPNPTQPLHTRTRPTQPPYQAPPTYPTPPYQAPPPNQLPPDATQPYQAPSYQPQQYQQPVYQQPAYQPVPPSAYPSTPMPAGQSSRHFWPILVLGLGLVFVFACGLAVWTLVSAGSFGTGS